MTTTETTVATQHTVLLDATNLAVRSWHAAQSTGMNSHGNATGPLVIFVNVLAKLTAELKPTHFVACWDGGGSTYRESLYADYKLARRQAQVNGGAPAAHAGSHGLIKEFLDLSGLGQWHSPGVEADDLIAAAHRRSTGKKIILSSDKDMLQLLDPDTIQIRFTGSVAPDTWTAQRVVAEMGCHPSNLSAVMALSGDTSDGIPGLPGIGPKRAAKMLTAVDWDWGRLLETLSNEQRSLATLCRSLVDLQDLAVIVPPVPVWDPPARHYSDAALGPSDATKLIEFCHRYELGVIEKRILSKTLWW